MAYFQLFEFDVLCSMLCNLKLINFMCIAQLESVWPIFKILNINDLLDHFHAKTNFVINQLPVIFHTF